MVAADDAGDDGGFVLNLINPAPAGGNARRPSLAVSGRKRKGQWKAKHLAKKAARASAWAPAAPDGGAGAAAQRPVASPAATAAATKQPDAANPGKRPVTKPSNHEQLRRRRRQDAAAGAADAGDADAGSAPPPAAAWQFAPAAAVNHGRPQVVSSLFSAIPELPAAPSASRDAEPAVRVAPSNAASSAAAHTFEALGVDADIAAHVTARLNVRRPTSIQRKVIPVLLNPGDDATNPVVRAQTGSGKTLSYLLPIVQRLLASGGDEAAPASRSLGTLAIVLTPTRELARQQAEVLDTILSLPPCTHTGKRRSHWIVAGTVSGGDKKKSEKARLRKGVTILVSTPGRLLDHLQNTESFAVEKLRWLVLDEADRLMDLGFEETIRKIVQILDSRARMHSQAAKAGAADSFGEVGCSPKRRQTILCSATLNDAVMRLADEDLTNTRVLEAELDVTPAEGKSAEEGVTEQSGANIAALSTTYNTPKQLRQLYVVTPAKLRLVALAAILKTMLPSAAKIAPKKSSKTIVFFSCCDAVDFYHELFSLAGAAKGGGEGVGGDDASSSDSDEDERTPQRRNRERAAAPAPSAELSAGSLTRTLPGTLLHGLPVLKLHGNLSQETRLLTYKTFRSLASGVLFCTDVAARGLDVPDVDRIVQFDPAADIRDYVHRVGRTARIGKGGEALLVLLPSETAYVDLLKARNLEVQETSAAELMAGGFGAKGDYKAAAQEAQMTFERFVLQDEQTIALARRAFLSSVRAYATHAASEKHIFHVRNLHLGHLAKSFALREAPGDVSAGAGGGGGGGGGGGSKKAERTLAGKKKERVDGGKKTKARVAPKWKNDISEFAVGDAIRAYAKR